MEHTPYAIIDLGTNTFHLLIAEMRAGSQIRLKHEEKFPARIGQGGISKGYISEEAWQRALQGLQHFRQQLDYFRVPDSNVVATATSAFRNASNGKALAEAIYAQNRIQIEIISGDKEAEYIYYGIRAAVAMDEKISLVIDIGGGSVEFIICNRQTIFWKQSFEIGAQRLLDVFMPSDPISMHALQKMHDYLQQKLIPLTNAVHQYAPQLLIGASGTFDTLCEIHYKKTRPEFRLSNQTETNLPVSAFYEIYQDILQKNRAQRLQIPGMAEIRVDMIVVACGIIDFILKTYKIPSIKASSYALKEGVLHQMLNAKLKQ